MALLLLIFLAVVLVCWALLLRWLLKKFKDKPWRKAWVVGVWLLVGLGPFVDQVLKFGYMYQYRCRADDAKLGIQNIISQPIEIRASDMKWLEKDTATSPERFSFQKVDGQTRRLDNSVLCGTATASIADYKYCNVDGAYRVETSDPVRFLKVIPIAVKATSWSEYRGSVVQRKMVYAWNGWAWLHHLLGEEAAIPLGPHGFSCDKTQQMRYTGVDIPTFKIIGN